jgi:hypothetical protein
MAVDCGSGCLQRSFEPAGVPLASVLPFAISAITLTDVREDLCFKMQEMTETGVVIVRDKASELFVPILVPRQIGCVPPRSR